MLYSFLASSTASKNSGIPSPVIAETPTACATPSAPLISRFPRQEWAHSQVLIELVQYETHAVHEAVHVPWSALAAVAPAVDERLLKRLKVAHPLDCKLVRGDVDLVEDEDERQPGLVQNSAIPQRWSVGVGKRERIVAHEHA